MLLCGRILCDKSCISSQVGSIALVRNKGVECHILWHQRQKTYRMVRLTMTAKMYIFVEVANVTYSISKNLKMTRDMDFKLCIYTDSMQIFGALIGRKKTDERHIIIDILVARQSFKRFEITWLGHVSGVNNPASGLTKIKHNGVLDEVIMMNKMKRSVEKWIERRYPYR